MTKSERAVRVRDITMNVAWVAVVVVFVSTIVWNVSGYIRGREPVKLELDAKTFEPVYERMDKMSEEMAAINSHLQALEIHQRNNWDRFEQWEFANSLESELHEAGVQVRVPKPARRSK